VFAAYYVSAELGIFREHGWEMPARILDLFAEFRALTNGRLALEEARARLIDALAHFGVDTLDALYKQEMIDLILRGGPWTDAEWQMILDYCEGDVAALLRLLPVMLPHIKLGPALLRGRYMAAASAIERNGAPIDAPLLNRLLTHWSTIKRGLITE
jgi:hypothetical protein